MRRYLFCGDIDEDSVSELLEWLESLDKKEVATLYIESGGGIAGYSEVVLDALKDRPKVIIEAVNSVASGAFHIFLFSKNKKKVNKYLQFAMAHRPDTWVSLSDAKREGVKGAHHIAAKDYKNICKYYEKDLKNILTKKQYKRFRKGEDVYLSREELKKIVKKINRKNKH